MFLDYVEDKGVCDYAHTEERIDCSVVFFSLLEMRLSNSGWRWLLCGKDLYESA